MRVKLLILFLLTFTSYQDNTPEGWHIFSEVEFVPKFFEEAGGHLAVPKVTEELKLIEGTEVELSGFYIPLELDSSIMLSALPYSSCFFCGGGGPETVAEVQVFPLPKKLAPDAFLRVRGKLKFNDSDLTHLNFILEDASVIKR